MRDKRLKYIGIGIVLLLFLFVGIWMIKNIFPTVNATVEIMNVLQPYLDAENQSMHLELDVDSGKQNLQLEAELYAISDEAEDYLVIKQENMDLYVVDNLLLLENGKAFLLTEEKQNSEGQKAKYMDILPVLAAAFDVFQITRTEEEGMVSYQIEVTGEQMRDILAATMASKAGSVEVLESLQVELIAKDGKLNQIQIGGSARTSDLQTSLSIVLSNFVVLSDEADKIPETIKNSVENVNKDELFCITEDLFRLMKAVKPLSDMENLKGNMNWKVSCGLLQIDKNMDLEKLYSWKENDSGEADEEDDVKNAEKLVGLVIAMIMEGELRCRENNGVYIYELTLEESAMKQLAETVASEMINYAVDFEKGNVELLVVEDTLSEITIEIAGSFNMIFTKTPVNVSVIFDLE